MAGVCRLAVRAARRESKVLITGESGVGKDLVARLIHSSSPRAHGPFVAVNCAGLSETLLESELFGHSKGSFTGAYRDKTGKLEQADGGTVFLDEVGEMSLRMQALLLRFLENGEIQPVGSDRHAQGVDVRVVAATNQDLASLVAVGQFREDLMYRIKVVHIVVPPLRERRDDVRPLVEHVLARLGRRLTFGAAALEALERYRWPGNVRELQNTMEQLCSMLERDTVELEDLPPALQKPEGTVIRPANERRRQVADDLYEGLVKGRLTFWGHVHPMFLARDLTRHDVRELLRRGLSATNGNYRAMLEMFGMNGRDYKRFLNFLSTHGCALDFREFRTGAAGTAPGARPFPPLSAVPAGPARAGRAS